MDKEAGAQWLAVAANAVRFISTVFRPFSEDIKKVELYKKRDIKRNNTMIDDTCSLHWYLK